MDEFGFPIDSEYLEFQSYFEEFPEQAQREVVVWTESDDDVRLWMRVFVDNTKYKFTFMPASKFKSEDGKSGNGCSRLIKLVETNDIIPGKQNIVCLDSDFKFIAQHSRDYNGKDYSLPHFFWTVVHSKEHIFLDSSLLDDIVSHSSCIPIAQLNQRTIDIYHAIAGEIYEPFVALIYILSLDFENPPEHTIKFQEDFRDSLSILLNVKKDTTNLTSCQSWSDFCSGMRSLQVKLTEHVTLIEKTDALALFIENLSHLGIDRKTIYLFTRGHDFEPITKHLTKCYLEQLQKLKFQEIAKTSNQVEEDIKAVRNRTPKLDQALMSTIPKVEKFPFFHSTLELARSTYSAE